MREDAQTAFPRHVDRVLHRRLVERDPTAPSDLVCRFLEPLTQWLNRRFAGMDPRDLEEIAFDTLARLAQEPQRYDPDRASLDTYLHMDAAGDARNLFQRFRRSRSREISLEAVEHSAPARNVIASDELDSAEQLARQEDADMASAWVDSRFVGSDREVVWLMFAGERRTEVYAHVLGLDAEPREQQRRAVKRAKDRVKAKLARMGAEIPKNG
ncbi:MAG TPA: hypothetical protein VFC51_08805 [Chloroflexota bacterium]|nr:hypothetical protein [Chloroflexota bacterium]